MTRPNAYLTGLGTVVVFISGALYHDSARDNKEPHRPPESFVRGVRDDKARSDKWEAFAKKCKAAHPYCAYCGGTAKLQAHHIAPFHLHPELELDESNVIILCELPDSDHHLHIGHLGNFKSEGNPHVREDCARHEADLRKAGEWPR